MIHSEIEKKINYDAQNWSEEESEHSRITEQIEGLIF